MDLGFSVQRLGSERMQKTLKTTKLLGVISYEDRCRHTLPTTTNLIRVNIQPYS